jgi:hypothetical protein
MKKLETKLPVYHAQIHYVFKGNQKVGHNHLTNFELRSHLVVKHLHNVPYLSTNL